MEIVKDKVIFRDPIHDLIIFDKEEDEIILKIIQTSEFQRLRRIRQLGLANFTYTSAVHDRFTHSIGVCFLAGLLFDNINVPTETVLSYVSPLSERKVDISFDKRTLKTVVKIAALLHDIGHGPFSHVFERAIKEVGLNGLDHLSQIQIHEQMGTAILTNNEFNIANILDSCSSDLIKSHGKFIIKDILEGHIAPFWIKEIISSQFDCDRIDYLLRDAYMCGVSYAKFDWKWLFNNIRLADISPAFQGQTVNEMFKIRLVINGQKGLYSLESYLVSRYHMHEQVYFHKTTQSVESITKNIFKRISYLYSSNKESGKFFDIVPFLDKSLLSFFDNPKDIKAFLKLDDFYMISHFSYWAENSSDDVLKELCTCIINRNVFKLFREYKSMDEAKIDSESLREKLLPDEFEYFFVFDERKNKVFKRDTDPDQIFISVKDEDGASVPEMASNESFLIQSLPREKIICRGFYYTGIKNKIV